jgi:pimeloyl-ACP methyl ester carboxylesterase
LCHIYLPPGWKIAARLNPVITLAATAGMAGSIANRMGQNYEQGHLIPTLKAGSDQGFPVFLVPRLGPPAGWRPGDLPVDLKAEAEACMAWAQHTFKASTVSVAGTDQGAGTALQLAVTSPETMKAIIVFAGGGLEPWPQADVDFIRRQLAGFPGELPVTWANFATETVISGQGPLILGALREMGINIVEVQDIKGGLNFTQVADRTVLWAEDLR